MKQTLTLVCKLQPSSEQQLRIEALLQAFSDACNFANQAVKSSIISKITIQNLIYREIRSKFGLSANQAIKVCARVGSSRKSSKAKGKTVKHFKPTSADYDARIFLFREKDWSVGLTLLDGREYIKLDIGKYQKDILSGRKPTSLQLCKHKNGLYYAHIQITNEVPKKIDSTEVIGVDLGRREIAKTSTNKGWNSEKLNKIRDKIAKTRASLQRKASKGTRSTRRRARQVLKRLSGKEKRFQQWLNHSISATIIREAKQLNAIVAIEDLTGIREAANRQPRTKLERKNSNSWGFYQLRQFLEYKGIKEGIQIVLVNPAYTSQTCNQCLHIGLRNDKRFRCNHCGWNGDADLNGAINIAKNGAVASRLRGSEYLSCDISLNISGLLKPPSEKMAELAYGSW